MHALLPSSLCFCCQGCVPPYLMDYFSYITKLEPCHCPDYQYLLSLLQVRNTWDVAACEVQSTRINCQMSSSADHEIHYCYFGCAWWPYCKAGPV
jgi:hypothetical protein